LDNEKQTEGMCLKLDCLGIMFYQKLWY